MAQLPADVSVGESGHADHHDALHAFYNLYDAGTLDADTLEGSTLAQVVAAAAAAATSATLFTDTITGDNSTTAWPITHSLGTNYVDVTAFTEINSVVEKVDVRFTPTSTNAGNVIIDDWNGDLGGAPVPSVD